MDKSDDKVKSILKKAGLYAAIGFIFIGIGALLALLIIRRGIDTGGIAGIDGNIFDIRDGITETTELNKSITDSAAEIRESNNEIRNGLREARKSADTLTGASERLADLIVKLQKRAREEGA